MSYRAFEITVSFYEHLLEIRKGENKNTHTHTHIGKDYNN